ncbi:MAG: nuclear transport factor 2 family protein [Proteobacteria bacterium]|nr:nuclear transport factor 2 family protein [Pseudomonadota bacterium]
MTGMVACLDEEVTFENVSNASGVMQLSGRPAFAEQARKAAALFSKRQQSVLNSVTGPEMAALDVAYVARLAADLPGLGKAGDEVRLRGASFFTLRDGRIVRIVDIS